MLYINITPPNLEDGVEHIGTVIKLFKDGEQIGDDITLTLDNSPSLLHYSADIELDKNSVYSAKARYIFEPGGYQTESDEFILNINDTDDTSIFKSPPIMIPVPTITNDLGFLGLPNTYNKFNISIDTNETIAYYLVIITDSNKRVIDKFRVDGDSDVIEVNNILEYNSIYTLNVMAISEANITSPISNVTFSTGKLRDRNYYVREDIGDYTYKEVKDLYLHIPDNLDYSKIEYIIDNTVVNNWTISDSHIDLRNKVNNNIDYILRITGYYNNEIYGPIYFHHFISIHSPINIINTINIRSCNTDIPNINSYRANFGIQHINNDDKQIKNETIFMSEIKIVSI